MPQKRSSNIFPCKFYVKTEWNSLQITRNKKHFKRQLSFCKCINKYPLFHVSSTPTMGVFWISPTIHSLTLRKQYTQETSGYSPKKLHTAFFFFWGGDPFLFFFQCFKNNLKFLKPLPIRLINCFKIFANPPLVTIYSGGLKGQYLK